MQRRATILLIATAAIIILLVATLAVSYTAVTREAALLKQDPVYNEPPQRVSALKNQNATSGTITLRVNNVSTDRDPATRLLWSVYERDKYAPLPSVPGSTYVFVNVTAANAMTRAQPFSYANLTLVGSDGRLYYANYAACLAGCNRTAVLKNQTLPAQSANAVLVAYSVPTTVTAAKLVYEGSRPQIVVDLRR